MSQHADGASGNPAPSTNGSAPRTWRRRTVLVTGGAVLVTTLVANAARVVGLRVRSPEQAAADAAPPGASPVTVAVERRVLAEAVVLRGIVKAGASIRLLAPASAVGPDSVITRVLCRVEQRLEDGDVIAERSGQPLIVLALPFPLYRDVVGGADGPDVTEVQRVLKRLGYRVTVTGRMDQATQTALGRFFADRGFRAPAGTPQAAAQITPAQAAVAEAQRQYDEAVAAGAGVAPARARLNEARQALAAATLGAGPTLPRSAVVRIDRPGRRVTTVTISVGTVLSEPGSGLLELDGEAPFVSAAATAEQAALLAVGQQGDLVDENTSARIPVRVTALAKAADEPGAPTDGSPAPAAPADSSAPTDPAPTDPAPAAGSADKGAQGNVEVHLAAVDRPLPAAGDSSMRVEVAPDVTQGPVLAVPVTAIYSRPDGSAFVTVLKEGAAADVTVTPGKVAGGWVEVSPADSTQLPEGSLVVVGQAAK